MRKTVIAGNWKMHKNWDEAMKFAVELRQQLNNKDQAVEVVICPPFTYIEPLANTFAKTDIQVGAQNVYWEEKGAFTGEISPAMLKDVGCQYVIIGHSERRQYFGETDDTVNLKVKASLNAGLTPIVCVGESLAQREQGEMENLISQQLKLGLAGLAEEQVSKIVVAYEPIWAIGTGKTATAEQAEEVCAFIRQQLGQLFSENAANQVVIQYGGSVKPENIAELMSQPNIDGALVGGASLEPSSFTAIVNYKGA